MSRLLSLILSLVVVAILSSCSSSPSPILPPAKLSAIKSEFSVTEKWVRQSGEGVSDHYYLLTPVFTNDTIYTIDYRGFLSATNYLTGDTIWNKQFNYSVSAGLAQIDNMLLFATNEGDVISLDINSGSELWKSKVSSEVFAKPVQAGKYVIVKSVDGRVAALDLKTGNSIWVYDRAVPPLTLRGNSAAVVYENTIIVGMDNGELIGLSLDTGQVIWKLAVAVPTGSTEIERMIDIDATPVIAGENLFVVTYQGRIANIHIPSGQLVWTRDFSAYNGFVVDATKLYVSDSNGYLWALDRKSGATIWKQDKLIRRSLTQPALYNKSIVVADFNGFVHWLDTEDGHLQARFRLGGYDSDIETEEDYTFPKSNSVLIAPVVFNNKLFVFDRHGYVSNLVVRN